MAGFTTCAATFSYLTTKWVLLNYIPNLYRNYFMLGKKAPCN